MNECLWKKLQIFVEENRHDSKKFKRISLVHLFVQLFHLIDDFVSLAPVARRPIIIVHLIEDCRGLGYHKSGTNEPYKKYNTRPRLFCSFFLFFHIFFSLFFLCFFIPFFFVFFLVFVFFFFFFFFFRFVLSQTSAPPDILASSC